jgi:hypothetical protein
MPLCSADIVHGSAQPVFTTPIVVDYYFDSLQYLRFEARPAAAACACPALTRTCRRVALLRF